MIASRPLQLCSAPLDSLSLCLLRSARMAMIFETAYTFYALLSEMAVIRARPQSVASRPRPPRLRAHAAVYVHVGSPVSACCPSLVSAGAPW